MDVKILERENNKVVVEAGGVGVQTIHLQQEQPHLLSLPPKNQIRERTQSAHKKWSECFRSTIF